MAAMTAKMHTGLDLTVEQTQGRQIYNTNEDVSLIMNAKQFSN